MLRRLIASAVLTLPLVLFPTVGALAGFPELPPFGLAVGLWGFVLGTPVVVWGGWAFFASAWRALRRREANMMASIALGVLVSYPYSVAATFLFEGEVF